MSITKINNIYAYIKTQNPENLKKEIFSKVTNQDCDGGVWKQETLQKSKQNYPCLKHTSDQLENEGYIDLVPKGDKLYIYVLKRSDGKKEESELASLFLGRFATAIFYHCQSVPHLVITRNNLTKR